MKRPPLLILASLFFVSCTNLKNIKPTASLEIKYLDSDTETLFPYTEQMFMASGRPQCKSFSLTDRIYKEEFKRITDCAEKISVYQNKYIVADSGEISFDETAEQTLRFHFETEKVIPDDIYVNVRMILTYKYKGKTTKILIGQNPSLIKINDSYYEIENSELNNIIDYYYNTYLKD